MRNFSYYLLLIALIAIPGIVLGQEFTPLTNLPGIKEASQADTLPTFFNTLYKLCIGAAAVIAVLQIMRAGTYFMFNKGSVAHNEKGKALIGNSILGLLLVLSPAIIFGIINRDILNLTLDVGELELGSVSTNPSLPTSFSISKEAYEDGVSESDVPASDRERYRAFARSCIESGGNPRISVAQGDPCLSENRACTAQARCEKSGQDQPAQPGGNPADQEFEWRQRFLEGGTLRGVHGRRFSNQQQCYNHSGSFAQEHPTWEVDARYQGCDCSAPRSQFPGCRN